MSGGGRCNVTHHAVDESAFAGSTRAAIRKVLRRYPVADTVRFFAELGVELKREETGKLFPVTDRARTVLDALLRAAREAGVTLRHPWRVETIERPRPGPFVLRSGSGGEIEADRVVLATGGRSLPRTGSDGHGYALARALGHSVTARVFPALVPLTLPRDHPLCALSGLSAPVRIEVRAGSGTVARGVRGLRSCARTSASPAPPSSTSAATGPTPAPTIPPRIWSSAGFPASVRRRSTRRSAASARGRPAACWSGGCPIASSEPSARWRASIPARRGHALTRAERGALVRALLEMPLPVTGDRGFNYAEVTAGGVPLGELRLETMESRTCPRPVPLRGDLRRGRPDRRLQFPVGLGQRLRRGAVRRAARP